MEWIRKMITFRIFKEGFTFWQYKQVTGAYFHTQAYPLNVWKSIHIQDSISLFAISAFVGVTCAPSSSTHRLSAAPFVNCLLSTEDYFKAVFVADSDKLIIARSSAKVLVQEKLSFIASRPLEIPRVLVTSEPDHLDLEGDTVNVVK